MSFSSSAPRYTLTVRTGEPGVALTVFTDQGRVAARVSGESDTLISSLERGLYTVRSTRAGVFRDQTIALSKSMEIQAKLPPRYTAFTIPGAKTSHEYYVEPAWQLSFTPNAKPLEWGGSPKASLLLFARAPSMSRRKGESPLNALKLRTLDGRTLASLSHGVKHNKGAGWAGYSTHASPGTLVLEDHSDAARQMVIPLLPGCQTQVFVMHHGRLLWEDMRVAIISMVDIESRQLRSPYEVIDEDQKSIMLSDQALLALQNNMHAIGPHLVRQALHAKFLNPIAGLIGAYLMLRGMPSNKPDIGLFHEVLGNLSQVMPGSADVLALRVLARPWIQDEPHILQADDQCVPMFRFGVEALLEASLSTPSLVPEGSMLDVIAEHMLTDLVWTSWSPVELPPMRTAARSHIKSLSGLELNVLDAMMISHRRGEVPTLEALARQLGVTIYAARAGFERVVAHARHNPDAILQAGINPTILSGDIAMPIAHSFEVKTASARVFAKLVSTLSSISAGAVRTWAEGIKTNSAAERAAVPPSHLTVEDAAPLDSENATDILPDFNAPLRIVPDLLLLLADTTRASSGHDREVSEQLAAEYCVLIERYGSIKPLIDAIATGRRRLHHAAPDKVHAWQQVMSVSASALEPALRRNHALLASLNEWVAAQPADLEHRLDRYRLWLDEDDPQFSERADDHRCCLNLLHAHDADCAVDLPAAQPAGPAAPSPIAEPGIPLMPPPLTPEPGEHLETILFFVIDAKHPAEQLTARSIDLAHQQLAEALRRSEDQIERLIGAIALNDFDFADAALTAQADRLGPVHAARLRGDRLYWEGRFGEAVPHYRAHLEHHDDLIARCNLACALLRSERGSRSDNAEEAITILRQTIGLIPKGTPERARVLMLLGAAREIAPFDTPEVRRSEALRCYEEALHSLERERDGIWWAGAHLHAGLALLGLHHSQHHANGEQVQHALNHFQDALEYWTRDSDPSHWSTVQNNLGRAWERLTTGDRRRNLENAKACFEAALEVRTKEEHPAAWARLQNNLGNLHLHLPDPDGSSHILRAIEHHTEAAKVWSAINRRLEWAGTQYNLGNAYALLPIRDSDPEQRDRNLHRAIACYKSSLEVRTRSSAPVDWATTMNNLGSVLMNIADQPSRSDHIDEAIRCFHHALEVRQRDNLPYDWARTTANLAHALAKKPNGDRARQLSEAMELLNEALEVATADRAPELHRHILHRRELVQRERAGGSFSNT